MCGTYDGSGEFCFRIGLRAKSGVGGGLALVVPGLMGVFIWPPSLNLSGNTVRGLELAARLVETYRLHLYDGLRSPAERIDPRVPLARTQASLTSEALLAAGIGEVRSIRRLHDERADLRAGDSDQRSPMHLAAAEGHPEVLEFLLEQGLNPNHPDRWGDLPLDEAILGGQSACEKVLIRHSGRKVDIKHVAGDGPHDESILYGDGDAVAELLWTACQGDFATLRRLIAQGVPVGVADHDGCTTLHLAAAENRVEATRCLIAHAQPKNVRDRWGATPMDEARREGAEDVVQYLETET